MIKFCPLRDCPLFFYLLVLERGRETERDLFHLFMHLLVDSCVCRIMLYPTELPSKG